MEELSKKWFQVVWACLLVASVVISHIPRMSDAQWAHSEAIQMLNSVLMWIMLPLTVVMFVWLCVGYWRQSERLFWRKWRRWSGALVIGVATAVLLVFLVKHTKGDCASIDEEDRVILLGVFAAAGLIYAVAQYKFRHWRRDE